jgi:hypothetical protein
VSFVIVNPQPTVEPGVPLTLPESVTVNDGVAESETAAPIHTSIVQKAEREFILTF